MIYRIMKHTKGDKVWFTAEWRFLYFFWRTCFFHYDEPATYESVETARAYIENHRRIHAKVKRERVITL